VLYTSRQKRRDYGTLGKQYRIAVPRQTSFYCTANLQTTRDSTKLKDWSSSPAPTTHRRFPKTKELSKQYRDKHRFIAVLISKSTRDPTELKDLVVVGGGNSAPTGQPTFSKNEILRHPRPSSTATNIALLQCEFTNPLETELKDLNVVGGGTAAPTSQPK
jgi:hypothetical protein